MNVFISWSGPRSKAVALALRQWLPTVIHSVIPFMSEQDIDKGTRGLNKIANELKKSTCGIICVTPENLSSQWLNFEAGAISKELNLNDSDASDGRVWTYLLGLSDSEVKGPLGQFQHTRSDKEETRRLVKSLHVISQTSLSPAQIDEEFEAKWPRLERKLKDIPDRGVTPRQSVEEMVCDLHQFMRWSQPVGITITFPTHGMKSKDQKIAMTGKAARTPNAGQIIVPFIQHGEEFRPQVWVKAEAGKEWKSDIWLMKKGKNTIHIVRPNPLGHNLVSYYNRVHTETNKWVSIVMKGLPNGLEVESSIDVQWTP